MTKPRFLPKFPIFVQDWLSSMRVRAMTLEERGAFLELLLLQWQEGGLPGGEDALLRLSGLRGSPADHPSIIEAFQLDEDGQRRNRKCAQVRAEADAFCDEQARKASLGGRAKAARGHDPGTFRAAPGHAPGVPGPLPESAPPTPTPTPSSDSDSDSSSASLRSAGADKPRRPSKPRKEATGPHAEAIRTWDALWLETRGEAFVWNGKEAASTAECLKLAGGDLLAFEDRASRLLRDPPDAWYAQNASPSILASRWNQLSVRIVRRAPTLDDRNMETLARTMEELIREG